MNSSDHNDDPEEIDTVKNTDELISDSDTEEQNFSVIPLPSNDTVSEKNESEEIERLKNILLMGSKNQNLMTLTEITAQSAAKYKEAISQKTTEKMNFHLDEVSAEPVGVARKRTDSRVSFQILTLKLKLDLNKLTFEYHQSKAASIKEKFAVSFQDLLGMKLESDTIIIDAQTLSKANRITQQGQNSSSLSRQKWSDEVDLLPSHDPESSQHIRIKLKLHDSKDVHLLSQSLKVSSILQTVLDRGLKDSYSMEKIDNISSPDIINFYPLVSDPLLCRAAQLVSLELTESFLNVEKQLTMEDVRNHVKSVSALQVTFERLITDRHKSRKKQKH